ncbi:hypothetical protein LOTGIDRAFT_136972, partial [Lottia gigantea]
TIPLDTQTKHPETPRHDTPSHPDTTPPNTQTKHPETPRHDTPSHPDTTPPSQPDITPLDT